MDKFSSALRAIEELRKRMGAKKVSWVSDPIEKFARELQEGKETIGIELEKGKDDLIVVVGPDGKLRQVFLYIPYGEDFKVHIAWCETLEGKYRDGSFNERYIYTNNRSGRFPVWRSETRKEYVNLDVCKNCLKKINWEGYKLYLWKRKAIFKDFTFHKLLEKYKPDFNKLPPRKDTDPPNDYTDDWEKISTEYKESRNWTCENENCGVNLREHKKYLHCHHKNHKRSDNQWENLQALCVLCHAEQHSHMSPSPEARELIEKLRPTNPT